jgi:hypothetical protein
LNIDTLNIILDSQGFSCSTKSNILYALLKNVDLCLIPGLEINETDLTRFKDLFNQYKKETIITNQLKKRKRYVYNIHEVENLIEEKFDDTDYRKLVALIYMWWPLRDDLKIKYLCDEENCILQENENLFLKIRHSKRIQEPICRKIPDNITSLILSYVKRNKIKTGDYLFGKGKHSWLIQRIFKKLGLNGNINLVRQMHRKKAIESEDVNHILSTANFSFHSVQTAEHYDQYSN